mmetsp:Transcript_4820/g.16387  ORF Transcript_4820/g.16387 Transcript_4820/m.16387 type:complete len:166 (-) Transcript_4820:536-1033(-)
MSASVVSMSRWFVGSSSTSRCGRRYIAAARQTRHFCPPDKVWIFWCGKRSPPRPNLARWPRSTSSCWFEPSPGYRSRSSESGVPKGSSCSSWCCARNSIFAPGSMVTSPSQGVRSPTSSLISVDLPDPLRPSKQIRDFASTDRSTSASRCRRAPGGGGGASGGAS